MDAPLTDKARATRRRILDAAISLFEERGYDKTTLRAIARAAGVSTGLAYRYFDSKDALVLALYAELAEQFSQRVAAAPEGSWSERSQAAMDASFQVLAPHRDTIGALLGAMVSRRGDGIYVPWAANQAQVRQGFIDAVAGARNAPSDPVRLGELLYLAHLGALLFWLLDRSADQVATERLRAWIHRTTPVLAASLQLPLVRGPVQSLVDIVQLGVYGDRPPGGAKESS